jgi:hypothetical protein
MSSSLNVRTRVERKVMATMTPSFPSHSIQSPMLNEGSVTMKAPLTRLPTTSWAAKPSATVGRGDDHRRTADDVAEPRCARGRHERDDDHRRTEHSPERLVERRLQLSRVERVANRGFEHEPADDV